MLSYINKVRVIYGCTLVTRVLSLVEASMFCYEKGTEKLEMAEKSSRTI